jgi:hypothetical protein
MWLDRVVGPRQPRDTVEQDEHILPTLGSARGHFIDHFRHLNMSVRWFIERGAEDLGLGVASHVGHFRRSLVDQ